MKAIKIFLVLLLTVAGICVLSPIDQPKRVTGFKVDFFEASWDAVDGAEEYAVIIDGLEYHTKNTYFPLFDYVKPGQTVEISVDVITYNPVVRRGELVTLEYTAENVTSGLVYTELSDGTYAVHCPEEKQLGKGKLVLPDTYRDAPVTAFLNTKNQQMVFFPGTTINEDTIYSNYSGTEYTKIKKIRLPSELTTIGNGALYKASIKSIYLPKTVTTIYESAFLECIELETVTGGEGITHIYDYAFSKCRNLSEFNFSESIKYVGGASFVEAGIKEARLPNVDSFHNYTFFGCSSLEKISLSENVDRIYSGDFLNTGWYNSQPDGILYLGNILYGYKGEMPENTELAVKCGIKNMVQRDLFKNQKNLASITFPEGITEIEISAFEGCENLHTVGLPDSLIEIRQNAFKKCKKLKTVSLPDGLTRIGGGAFHASGLERITLPEALEIIDDGMMPVGINLPVCQGVFAECKNLKEILIPNSTRVIGECAFYKCTALTNITIEDGVEEIRHGVIYGCTSLGQFVIPDSVEYFEFHSIAYSGIKHFVFPKNINYIFFYTPQYKNGILLDYIVIQNGTKLLDYNWFYIYPNLKTFYFEGTKDEYNAIKKYSTANKGFGESSKYNWVKEQLIAEWLKELDVCYYSEETPAGEGSYWRYVDGVPTKW